MAAVSPPIRQHRVKRGGGREFYSSHLDVPMSDSCLWVMLERTLSLSLSSANVVVMLKPAGFYILF